MEENPYQPPRFDELSKIGLDAGAGTGAGGLTEGEIKAFVGKNAGYYLKKWPPPAEPYGGAMGFNWAAFLLSGFWLPYRKMYRMTLLMYGVVAGEELLEMAALAGGLANEQTLAPIGRIFGLAFSIVCGFFGNSWYLAHTRRMIGQLRTLDMQPEAYREALVRRGGTSLAASLGMFCLFVVVLFMIGFVFELLNEMGAAN